MIHRYLHAILTEGVGIITADPSYLDELFADNYNLTEPEVLAIKTHFADHPPTVINGYARKDSKFPLFAIILGAEGEEIKFLGDDAGSIDDPDDPFYRADVSSAIWGHSYDILIYSEHPDVTAWYYEIAKYLLLAGFPTLVDLGCFEFQTSGQDLAPDPRYLPEYLFARRLNIKMQREFQQIDRESRMTKAFKIAGIAIDSTGSTSDVGGVKTNVKPYIR